MATLLVVLGLLAVTQLLPPWAVARNPEAAQILRFTLYLTVFSVWMWWFVTTGVEYLQEVRSDGGE